MYAFLSVEVPTGARAAADVAGESVDALYALSLLEETGDLRGAGFRVRAGGRAGEVLDDLPAPRGPACGGDPGVCEPPQEFLRAVRRADVAPKSML